MDRDTASMIDKPIYYEMDDDIIFSAPPKPKPSTTPTILAFGILPANHNGQVALATQNGYRVVSEQGFYDELDAIEAAELLADIEAHLGCSVDFPGISPVALGEAKERNVWDWGDRKTF